MKKLIIVMALVIAGLIAIHTVIDRQIEAYNNTQVTVIEADRCQHDVENGMPVEFCD